MQTTDKTIITVKTTVEAPIDRVWKLFTTPEDITKWNQASDDWHSPFAENDLRIGGKFLYRMEAKDGSFGFDFWGIYDEVITNKRITYTMGDGRKAEVNFTSNGNSTALVETFEAEGTNPIDLQRGGWQAILDNFKRYVETNR
jgi:uncharacterized protein YndB with AHSA1/START domain